MELFFLNFKSSIEQGDPSERLSQLPADSGIRDFGFLPRARYPLVVLLTLAEPDVRELYEIVSDLGALFIFCAACDLNCIIEKLPTVDCTN